MTQRYEAVEGRADVALPAFQDVRLASSLAGNLLMQGRPMQRFVAAMVGRYRRMGMHHLRKRVTGLSVIAFGNAPCPVQHIPVPATKSRQHMCSLLSLDVPVQYCFLETILPAAIRFVNIVSRETSHRNSDGLI